MADTAKKKLLLLIAESDLKNRTLYRKFVSSEIFELVLVANGDSVQDAYIYKRPDILLIDLDLSGKSGLDVIKWVRIARRDNDLTILVTASDEDNGQLSKCEMLGIQGVLKKPLDYKAINSLLMEHHVVETPVQEEPPVTQKATPLRVLIAEDDKKVAILYKRFLSEDDFSIQIVGNGIEAMKAYSEWNPNVVILDLNMPELSGQDFLKEVRAMQSDFTTTVIIASSESSPQVVKDCARYEIQGYLVKPFNLKKLGTFIKAYRKKHLDKLRTSGMLENK